MKAVMYLRVSTKEQAEEGYSIAAQAEACRRFIADKGWELVDEFVDRGESARTADRPQFQLMLQRLTDDPSVGYLVVHKLDRLARNLEDHTRVRAMLRKADVQLASVTESIEEGASGKLVEGILASIAEFYSANLSQEIKKGVNQKAAQGGWPTIAPYGYRNVRREAGGRRGEALLEPDEQAPLVVWAFEQYATGHYNLPDITDALAAKGFRNRRGAPPRVSAVHRMLRKPIYTGVVVWKGVEYAGIHEPLISRDLFDKVQAIMDSHSTGGDRSWKHDHYLKGMLFCADCGSRLYYVVAKGQFGYFRCVGRNTKRKQCSQSGYMPAKNLERAVEAIYERVRIPPRLAKGVEKALKQEVSEREKHRAEATVFLGRRLKQLANEREKLLKAYYGDAIDVATLKREQARINAEVAEAEAQLSGEALKLEQAMKVIELALELAESCRAGYARAKPEVRELMNQAFFRKILVKNGGPLNAEYEEPFAYLLSDGSHKSTIVEVSGRCVNRLDLLFSLHEELSA